ncbi:DUF2935 domain-containing protein [Tuberibacillus sp. Marseille-P3662]|uniref:DUF2935 domain-containing protein n=1 Tax=Tuberibacillus sp. Marseille-P3662 TaxID=1965358 RepID=UPI000A1C9B91|nr:DUF2935 domain-containing protein [Tuberibacillus sp. Marseille-P3662]
MNQTSYIETTLFEHRFWLQILGDHARFIHSSLSPNENQYISTAQGYIQIFDQLLTRSRQTGLSDDEIVSLTQSADQYARRIRAFKLKILSDHLYADVNIHLSPTFINHMVNEVEEYIRVLKYLMKGEIPQVPHEIHHHMLWLQDAYGHSGAINDQLDGTEYTLKEKTQSFTKTFQHFYLKAVEMAGYLRTHVNEFPALQRFNQQANTEMAIFKDFLRELEEMELKGEVLDVLTPLMADHMAREECYYLIKLAESQEQPLPNCDPTQPRTHSG